MSLDLSDLPVIEDCIHLVKGENGQMFICIPTCSAIKFSNGVTLQTLLESILARLTALENGANLTWNGIPSNQQQS